MVIGWLTDWRASVFSRGWGAGSDVPSSAGGAGSRPSFSLKKITKNKRNTKSTLFSYNYYNSFLLALASSDVLAASLSDDLIQMLYQRLVGWVVGYAGRYNIRHTSDGRQFWWQRLQVV